jgi:hypothetical protein
MSISRPLNQLSQDKLIGLVLFWDRYQSDFQGKSSSKELGGKGILIHHQSSSFGYRKRLK